MDVVANHFFPQRLKWTIINLVNIPEKHVSERGLIMEFFKKNRLVVMFMFLLLVIFVFSMVMGFGDDGDYDGYPSEEVQNGYDEPGQEEDDAVEDHVVAAPEMPEWNIPLRSYFPHALAEDFEERMPLFDHLMDPFTFFAYSVGATPEQFVAYGIPASGRVETAADWELRRAEIRDLIMYYYFGYMWPTTYENVVVNTTERPTSGGVINITVNETRLDGSSVTATGDVAVGIFLPSFAQLEANGFWNTATNSGSGGPLVIGTFHFFTEEQIAGFLERGIGVALTYGTPGWGESRDGMYFDLFPFDQFTTQYNTGTLMAGAWTVSRIIDAFQLNPEWGVNPYAIATIGNSFAGKRALFAGVMDDRVALTIPHESGGDGGVAPFRHSHAGRIHFYHDDGINRVHSRHETSRTGSSGRSAQNVAVFFRGTRAYEESIYLLPFDMHLVIALTAPTFNNPNRAFLSLETDNFGTWTGWSPARTVAAAAEEVFLFLDADNLAFRQKRSGHMPHDTDYPVIWAIIDHLFGQPVHDTATGFRGGREAGQVYVEDVFNVALSGVWDSVSELGRSPIDVDSAWMPWSRPGVHSLWTDTQLVTAGYPAVIRAYTDAPYVYLILWSHGDGNQLWGPDNPPVELGRWNSHTMNGVVTFELSGDDIVVGRFELVVPTGRSVFIQAIDSHTALRSGTTRDNIGGGGGSTMIGFTSRIVPDILRVYQRNSDGDENRINPSLFQGGGHWLMPYGVRLAAIAGTGDERAHILRGLQFEAMPGFTFEMSFQENLHTADQPSAIWLSSPEVRHIGPYPHWRPGGTGARPTAEPTSPLGNRDSNFDITLTHALVGNEWIIDFSGAVNPRDFGIGFNFSRDFELNWQDDNTRLVVVFRDFYFDVSYEAGDRRELVMYINRLRGEEGNSILDVINTPIRYVV